MVENPGVFNDDEIDESEMSETDEEVNENLVEKRLDVNEISERLKRILSEIDTDLLIT